MFIILALITIGLIAFWIFDDSDSDGARAFVVFFAMITVVYLIFAIIYSSRPPYAESEVLQSTKEYNLSIELSSEEYSKAMVTKDFNTDFEFTQYKFAEVKPITNFWIFPFHVGRPEAIVWKVTPVNVIKNMEEE